MATPPYLHTRDGRRDRTMQCTPQPQMIVCSVSVGPVVRPVWHGACSESCARHTIGKRKNKRLRIQFTENELMNGTTQIENRITSATRLRDEIHVWHIYPVVCGLSMTPWTLRNRHYDSFYYEVMGVLSSRDTVNGITAGGNRSFLTKNENSTGRCACLDFIFILCEFTFRRID